MDGNFRFNTLTNAASNASVTLSKTHPVVKAQADSSETSRRTVIGLVSLGLISGTFVQAVLADAKKIPVGPPPPPSGGLSGTLNSDDARDLKLPLKNRFYLQPLPPTEAVARAKESAKDIINVKEFSSKNYQASSSTALTAWTMQQRSRVQKMQRRLMLQQCLV